MQTRWAAATFCLAAVVSLSQVSSELPADLIALTRIKSRMREVIRRQPNYVCVEQIERSRRSGPKRRYELVDMVRLEVAYVDGKELFAWPGSNKFETAEFDKLIPSGGAFGNGTFGLLVQAVFNSNSPVFVYKGSEDLNGRKTEHFDFRVSQMNSGYNIRTNLASATVGFHGSFWADAANYDVLRLEVYGDDIPVAVGLTESSNKIDYNRVKLGENDFLLPSLSELTMVGLKGDESRNRTLFSGCRQYTGESVLTFSDAPIDETAPEAKREKDIVEVPVGTWFDVTLETEVDSRTSAVGDPVTAVLIDSIKVKRKLLFPPKSIVRGNITRIERGSEYTAIEIRFNEMESVSAKAVIAARIDEQRLQANRNRQPVKGVLFVRGNQAHLGKGFRLPLAVR